MCKVILLCFVFIFNKLCCEGLGIFHENTRITFGPDEVAHYFGYTVLLNDTGLFVGAPKARSRTKKSISPGLVFSCPLDNLERKNITCKPFMNNAIQSRFTWRSDYIKDDMWFGAVIAVVPTGKLLVCAPRWTVPYRNTHYLANGACLIYAQKTGQWLIPLQDMHHQAYIVDGKRKEYGEYGLHLNFYAYGQAGMAAKVTEGNTLVIGAPGLLQWTGGISEYLLYPDYSTRTVKIGMRLTTNTYNTKDLGPDDYLGYSVESGKFDSSGKTLYVAGAPRSKAGYGQVLIFDQSLRETDPLNIKAKVYGPHLGSYFGASILCNDVNGDAVVDLLVGAPNYVEQGGGLLYDQGAVFVYLTDRQNTTFVLKEAGFVMGSGKSGARFGTAIAELGDVDGDGFTDVAIGAPWEDDGMGAVYIYRGSPTGLKSSYVQKIVAPDAKSFGISISKGIDVDSNNCNDLAVGAYQTGTAYVFRCIPTMQVLTVINVPDVMDLPQNVTNFTALFCVEAPAKKMWPYVKIDLKAKITVDPEGNRAGISGDSEYNVSVKPGNNACEEQTVEVMPTADLSKPISIQFSLVAMELMKENSSSFLMNAARLSEDSVLQTNFDIQLTRGCGEDLICRPLLTMTLEPLVNPYVPGSDERLGFTIKVINKEEPAYGAKVYLQLPSNPKRLPSDCILEQLNVTCKVPSPLYKDDLVLWDIELESTLKSIIDKELRVLARLEDYLHKNDSTFEELKITVTPMANISISSKALPNKTIAVTRDKFNEAGIVSFTHYYEVTNFGPSDWYRLSATLDVPYQALKTESLLSNGVSNESAVSTSDDYALSRMNPMVNFSSPVKGCLKHYNKMECTWSLPAKVSMPVILQLRLDLGVYKENLEKNVSVNVTSKIEILLEGEHQSLSTITTLVLDPAPPSWPLIVGSIAGFTLLAAFVYGLYRCGFFSRKKRDDLKKLREQSLLLEEPNSSVADVTATSNDESTQELIVVGDSD